MHVGQLEGGGFLESNLLNEVTSMPEGKKGLCYEDSKLVDTSEMPRPTATQAGTLPSDPQLHHCSEQFHSP